MAMYSLDTVTRTILPVSYNLAYILYPTYVYTTVSRNTVIRDCGNDFHVSLPVDPIIDASNSSFNFRTATMHAVMQSPRNRVPDKLDTRCSQPAIL